MSQWTEVGPDAFINAAIEAGVRIGVEALDPSDRLNFRTGARFRCSWSR